MYERDQISNELSASETIEDADLNEGIDESDIGEDKRAFVREEEEKSLYEDIESEGGVKVNQIGIITKKKSTNNASSFATNNNIFGAK